MEPPPQSTSVVRTAYITHLADANRGGQVNLLRLLENLDRAKHQSMVVLPGAGSLQASLEALGIRWVVTSAVMRSHRWVPYQIRRRLVLRSLAPVIRSFRPDVIYADALRDVWLAKQLSRSTGAALAWHAQTAMHSARDASQISLANVVVAVAPHVMELIRSLAPDANVECVPNAVDVTQFTPGDDATLRRDYGVQDDQLVILYVGGLYEAKGIRDLIEAFARVCAEFPHARLWIVGGGPEEQALQALAARLGVASCLRLFGVRGDVSRFYRASDVFCLPSHTEGLPLSVLEAMSSGLACVGSDIPGIAHLLSGGCGLMATVQNPVRLAEAIGAALRSGDLRRALGERARQRILSDYPISNYVTQFDALWRRLAGEGL